MIVSLAFASNTLEREAINDPDIPSLTHKINYILSRHLSEEEEEPDPCVVDSETNKTETNETFLECKQRSIKEDM